MDRELLAGALASISRKDRTEREVRDWLDAQGCDAEMAEVLIAHLIEKLAINDSRFAREYVRDKRELSAWGDERIRDALIDRGISRDLIETAISDDEETQVTRAVRFLEGKGVVPVDDKARQRALGMLARRGFSAEDSYAAIRVLGGRRAA